jgi:uncharacterized peroxidase-related enzyme
MYVRVVPPEEAEGDVRRIYDFDLEHDGYISNTTLLYSLNPSAYTAMDPLFDAIAAQLTERRFELATIAAARVLRCRYCVSAHADQLLKSKIFDRDQLEAIVRDYRTAGLDAVEVAIMALAEKVALDAWRVTQEDVDALREHGLGDIEIFNVVLAAAARAMFSKSLDAMGAATDDALSSTSDLFDMVDLSTLPGHKTSLG